MKCRHHPDRESTHVVDLGKVPVCDECAIAEEENGLLVLEDADVLDAEIIDA